MGQTTVNATSTVPVFTVPSGLCNVTFYTLSAPTLFVGTRNTVNANNGLQCHSIPTSFTNYVSSSGATFFAANTAASSAVVNYIIVTDQ
jgi:hypothetical protein